MPFPDLAGQHMDTSNLGDISTRSNFTPAPPGDVDGFLRQLLHAMADFRDGNFAARMPADLTGVPGKVADIFNSMVVISERRTLEISRVCHVVGKEGRLRERVVVEGATGARAHEVAAINGLIDDLGLPHH